MSVEEKFRGFGYVKTNQQVHHDLKCGHCGKDVSGWEMARYQDSVGIHIFWVLCPLCSHGSVIDRNGKSYPSPKYGNKIEHLPGDIEELHNEARDCMSLKAHTGAELVCRKIIMHIAIDKCESTEGLSFKEYIDIIEKKGYITPQMKSWVDEIRNSPNNATHKRIIPKEPEASNILNFTEQLLKLVYEIPSKAPKSVQQSKS